MMQQNRYYWMKPASITQPETVPVTIRSIFSILAFQIVFYAVVFVLVYWIATLNWFWLLICAIISFLQLSIQGKNQTYINFVLGVLRPQDFFSVARYYSQPVPAHQKTMFTYHPHSIFSYGLLCNANNKHFPDQKLTNAITLGSRFMLSLPVIGIHFRFWGVQSVDPKNLRKLMKQGRDISLVPGGYEEATLTTPHQLRVYVKQRKGFIKYALKYGYTIRPVLITNQHKALNTLDILLKFRLLLNKIKMPGTIYWCKYGILFPPGIRMHTLIGRGLRSNKIYESNEEPKSEQINQMHSKYIEQIKRLYEEHKQKNGNAPFVIY